MTFRDYFHLLRLSGVVKGLKLTSLSSWASVSFHKKLKLKKPQEVPSVWHRSVNLSAERFKFNDPLSVALIKSS